MNNEDFGIKPAFKLALIAIQIVGLCKLAVMGFEYLVRVLA
ncbi:hypothetical protein [Variovorax sp. RA8]|nr:hypothetical protein [Variovorax sp. RA8]VTU34522.1 hypothetical protein RA8CHR_04990 [Variovorax sp. RA8]